MTVNGVSRSFNASWIGQKSLLFMQRHPPPPNTKLFRFLAKHLKPTVTGLSRPTEDFSEVQSNRVKSLRFKHTKMSEQVRLKQGLQHQPVALKKLETIVLIHLFIMPM